MSSRPPPDDDRTVVRPASGADSQHGGFVTSSSFLGHTLPEGTVIGGLEITGLIGEGGFGIVYLAYDSGLQRQVAVKEYMPSSLAARASGSMDVQVKSERHVDTFKAGLKSFVNEARLLAKFDHDSLVKVFRFWEANGTAYMAMPYYQGPTLKRALAEMHGPPDEAQLRAWLHPILDALAVMHQARCFHRDIAPDNILLTASGPLLLDFGAARHVIGDMTHALTVVLKPGYAPIEQYGDSSHMAQGAWTDLYALACVVYYAITGKAPMTSVERLMDDRLEPLTQIAAGRYSEGFLRAIDAALQVRPADRPQDVAAFRALLGADPAAPPATARPLPIPAPSPARGDDAATRVVRPDAQASTFAPTALSPRPPPVSAPPPHAERTAWAPEPAVRDRGPPALPPAVPRDLRPYALGGGALLLVVSAWLLYEALRSHAPVSVPAPAPAASAVSAAASQAPQAPSASSPPLVVTQPAPAAVDDTASAAETNVARPAAEPAYTASEPTLAEAPPKPKPKPARPPEARRPPRPTLAETPPTNATSRPARCSDILQKASLETLNAEEAAFLRRECR
jgi:serine/threonine protein kinase